MNDETLQLVADLESEYDQDSGFLGLLRTGHFDTFARDRFLRLLRSIEFDSPDVIERRVVSLLWYVPMFMQWQQNRLDPDEWDILQQAINAVTSELERVLGAP